MVRSTQNTTDNTKSTEATPSTTVQNNLPNADASASGSGSQDQRQEETTNYEIGKTVRTLVREQPQIRRISLAVMVDGVDVRNAKGEVQWQPRTPEELERIANLVHGAIGYDEKRGDQVEVVNMRFVPTTSWWPPSRRCSVFALEKADLMRLAQTGLVGVLGTAGAAAGAAADDAAADRPARHRGRRPGARRWPAAVTRAAAWWPVARWAPGAVGWRRRAAPRRRRPVSRPQRRGRAWSTCRNVEGQMRASSIRRIAELVDKHPEESLSIVRSWMQQEAA